MKRCFGVLALVALGTACSMRGAPRPVDEEAAREAIEATAPDQPLRAVFGWRILDGEARFSGTGAARLEGPYRARLDLFGAGDEHYVSAALVGEELRVPGDPGAALPPPAMMWAVLGVVRPAEGAVLASTDRARDGLSLELEYRTAERRLRYVLEDGRLRSAEWRGAGWHMVVELEGTWDGLPRRSAFRDWSRGTELHIELESVDAVEPYPNEIWTPGR